MNYFDSDMSKKTSTLVYFNWKTVMSHTIYAAKFEQTIIHQHVYLRRESQSYDPGACANEIIPNREIAHLFTKRKKGVMLEYNI